MGDLYARTTPKPRQDRGTPSRERAKDARVETLAQFVVQADKPDVRRVA